MKKLPIIITAADQEELACAIIGLGKLNDRGNIEVSELRAELARAEIVAAENTPPDVITMNSRAEVLDLDSGERLELTVVFPRDARIEDGKISVLAPLGTALLGQRVGDEFEWVVPYGRRRLKVLALLFQPEAASKSAPVDSGASHFGAGGAEGRSHREAASLTRSSDAINLPESQHIFGGH